MRIARCLLVRTVTEEEEEVLPFLEVFPAAEKFPQKFWKWSEYHITLGDGRRLDGETLHLTEAFVTAMRIKRTKSNN